MSIDKENLKYQLKQNEEKMSESKIKDGDLVIHTCDEGGGITIGRIEITDDHKEDDGSCIEGNLNLSSGGSISPVYLEQCEVISKTVHNYIFFLEEIREKIGELAEEKLGMQYKEY